MKIGDEIPDFELKNQNNETFRLYDVKDKKILLSFHPLAWTSVCAKQMQALEEAKERLDQLGVIAVGISVDSVPSKKAWAESLGISKTQLLADFWPHGKLAEQLELFIHDKGIAKRANVLIDENKRIIWLKEYELSELPDLEEVINVIKEQF